MRIIEDFNDILSTDNPDHDPVILTSDLILFNHPPMSLSPHDARDLVDLIMTGKHVIVKLKYRQNSERPVTARLLKAMVAIDAEKMTKIRTHVGQQMNNLWNMIEKLKADVGF